jgi:hypothetical protein
MGPKTNVGITALGGSLGAILVWVLTLVGLSVPDTVGAAIATACAIILGWVVPSSLWMKEGV